MHCFIYAFKIEVGGRKILKEKVINIFLKHGGGVVLLP